MSHIKTKTCMDHIFTKNINVKYLQSYILQCKNTDHYGSIVSLNLQKNYNPNKTKQ